MLWEEWENHGYANFYHGLYGMVIDAQGNPQRAAKLLTDQHHLHRGDDAFLLGGRAAWLTADAGNQTFQLHSVDAALNYIMVTIPFNPPAANLGRMAPSAE